MSVTACGWAHRDLPRALVESTPCTAHTAGAEPARARQCVGDVTVVSGARDTVHTPTETGPRAFPAASERTPPSAPPMGLCTPEAERRRAFKHVLNSLYDFTVSRVSASEPQSQPASQERACPCLVNQSHATFLTCKNRECEKLRRQCAHDTASGGHAAQRARARQDPWSPDRERDGRGRLLRPQLQECTPTHHPPTQKEGVGPGARSQPARSRRRTRLAPERPLARWVGCITPGAVPRSLPF